jgi:GT2 family glycosyltransferase
MLNAEFPGVRLLPIPLNGGIAKARNQGIEAAKGAYILLVNADTICGKETIEKVLDFMDTAYRCQRIGVRMLGTQGNFLKRVKHVV